MKKWKQLLTGTAICLSLLLGNIIPVSAEMGSGFDLSKNPLPADVSSEPFICYIYVENNPDNPYNNPNRNIILRFGGKAEYYYYAKSNLFADDEVYQNERIFRATGMIPSNEKLGLTVESTDANALVFSYDVYADGKRFQWGDTLPVKEGHNEYYVVGGSSEWVGEHAEEKYKEMYAAFHGTPIPHYEDVDGTATRVEDGSEALTEQSLSTEASYIKESESEQLNPSIPTMETEEKKSFPFVPVAIVAVITILVLVGIGKLRK